jgi:hypothetical protein
MSEIECINGFYYELIQQKDILKYNNKDGLTKESAIPYIYTESKRKCIKEIKNKEYHIIDIVSGELADYLYNRFFVENGIKSINENVESPCMYYDDNPLRVAIHKQSTYFAIYDIDNDYWYLGINTVGINLYLGYCIIFDYRYNNLNELKKDYSKVKDKIIVDV